jgi:hypothetical protein
MSSSVQNNTTTQPVNVNSQPQQDQTNRQSQFNQFTGDLEKQLHDLELSFSRQLSELRKKLNTQTVEIKDETDTLKDRTNTMKEETTNTNTTSKTKEETKMETEHTNKATTDRKPFHYSVQYSSSSTYKDGVRDVKERIEIKDPEKNVVAERLPGKEEFEVKTLKQGDKDPVTQTVPAHQLKNEIDQIYGNMQHQFEDEFSRFGFPFNRSRSLFGSHDLPMLEPQRMFRENLAIEPENTAGDRDSNTTTLANTNNREVARHNRRRSPFGGDLFRNEIMNIEREMEMMRRRMDHEMRRFFDF